MLTFLFEYTNWSFGSDFPYNSIMLGKCIRGKKKFGKDHLDECLCPQVEANLHSIDVVFLPQYVINL